MVVGEEGGVGEGDVEEGDFSYLRLFLCSCL